MISALPAESMTNARPSARLMMMNGWGLRRVWFWVLREGGGVSARNGRSGLGTPVDEKITHRPAKGRVETETERRGLLGRTAASSWVVSTETMFMLVAAPMRALGVSRVLMKVRAGVPRHRFKLCNANGFFRANPRDPRHHLFACSPSRKPRGKKQRHTTTRTQKHHSSNAMAGRKARARKKKSERRDANSAANAANAGEVIPGLPDHLVAAHVLRSEFFDDPADLARLPAVSRAIRDAMAAAGFRYEELDEDNAVELGCFSALQRLERRGILSRRERLCEAAARVGNLEELKVLRADGCPWDAKTCSGAARDGHLELLKWARANRCPWDKWTCAWAANDGHIEVLQWLRPKGFLALMKRCPWDAETCMRAAAGGHLEVLQWLRENGCPWNAKTCGYAAQGGNLEVLQWARANGCPWDSNTCACAAEEGHLEVLQWARENGCPWNEYTCAMAAQGGHRETLQ